MAFVTDNHDPSGLGMFSKKVKTDEEKDEMDLDKKDELLEILPPEKETKKQKGPEVKKPEEKHRREESQPFSRMLSRKKVDERLVEKNPPPPCGYYKPKYTEIDRRPHLVWDFLKTTTSMKNQSKSLMKTSKMSLKSAKNSQNSFKDEESFWKPIAERVRPKVVGPIGLAKQKSRNSLALKSPCNPHEARFKVLKLSETWSNMRKTPGFNLRKKIGREMNKMYINKEFAPDYNPNFEYGKEKIGKQIIPFQKMISRKYVPKIPSTTNENFFDWDYYTKTKNSHVYRKIITPDFKKQLPREADSNTKLPGFMQKFLNTRMTITLLTQKMIEMNNYMDGNFQGIYSSFKTPAKKMEKEEDESVSIDDQD